MPVQHVVQPGEHLSAIAARYGVASWKVLWDAPENAALRQRRKNPNVLLHRDVVVIPDRGDREESGSTAQRHRFRLRRETLRLRIVLEDPFRRPIIGSDCDLHAGDCEKLVTDQEGRVERAIPPDLAQADLVVRQTDSSFENAVLRLHVGHLDPVDAFSGQVGRLVNLGYLAQLPETKDEPVFRSAVEEFQCDHALAVDGTCGPMTQSKLVQVHGC